MNGSTEGLRFIDQPDPFEKLPALAKRLGVKPCDHDGFLIVTQQGERYDVFELITAVLDRLDRAV